MINQLIQTLLALHSLGKQEVENLKQELSDQLAGGLHDELKLFVGVKIFNDLEAPDIIKPYALQALQKFDKNDKIIVGNVELKIEGHSVYDYSNDSVWNRIKAKENEIATLRKNREKALKYAPKPDALKNVEAQVEVDTETGELIKVLPPIVKTSEIIKTKIS